MRNQQHSTATSARHAGSVVQPSVLSGPMDRARRLELASLEELTLGHHATAERLWAAAEQAREAVG